MTNTYKSGASDMQKMAEELRLIRCCLERILRHMNSEDLFVDYQHEKFGDNHEA